LFADDDCLWRCGALTLQAGALPLFALGMDAGPRRTWQGAGPHDNGEASTTTCTQFVFFVALVLLLFHMPSYGRHQQR